MGPVILLILDGWGVSQEARGNAIVQTKTPTYSDMLKRFPNSLLDASGLAVGLPPGLMGNSEVGHLTIGSGRAVTQKLTLLSNTILDGTFFKNPILMAAVHHLQKTQGKLHLIGLVSDGCVHSSLDHLDGLIELARQNNLPDVIIHPILDGRDTPPRSARRFMKQLESKLTARERIGVVAGRYYAMDRDKRWDRVELYYRALALGEGRPAITAVDAVDDAYSLGENDEFVKPYIITDVQIEDGDAVICFNFRPDRVREISRVLTDKLFNEFSRPALPNIHYVCLTEYDASLNLPVAFNPQLSTEDIAVTLPELLSCHQIGQFHTAETEKYAHVTYFFNGGKEALEPLEERRLVESLKVATYDLAPRMQTAEVCDVACAAILSGRYPFIVLNFANPDMVGHTGIMEAAVEAVKSVDEAFAKLLAATEMAGGTLLITADHGNVEQMIDFGTGEPHTAHTTNPVPFIVANFQALDKAGTPVKNGFTLANGGLSDVAPTVIEIMGLEKPVGMNGHSLIEW